MYLIDLSTVVQLSSEQLEFLSKEIREMRGGNYHAWTLGLANSIYSWQGNTGRITQSTPR